MCSTKMCRKYRFMKRKAVKQHLLQIFLLCKIDKKIIKHISNTSHNGHRGLIRIVVGFTTTYAANALSPLRL